MKKLLLLSVMVLAGLSASAQFKSKSSSVVPQTNSKVVNKPQSQRSFQAVAPRQDLRMRNDARGLLTLDPAKVKPITRAERTLAKMPAMQNKVLTNKAQSRRMVNLQPTITLDPQASTKAKAARKTPAFAEQYIGTGYDYFEKEDVQWTMIPSVATYIDPATGEEKDVDVLVDVIPAPDFLSALYPDGIPVEFTVDDDDVITIMPQAIAHYEDEENGTTNYITLFNAMSDDGLILMKVAENGKLSITNGNIICFGEFADVEFDEDMGDSEAYLGADEVIDDVNYYFNIENRIDKEYNGHGVDYFANDAADWVMQRGTMVMDDEESHFFVDMVPFLDIFSDIYPNGIDVEYEQVGHTITVMPQVIASTTDDEGNTEYIILSSYDSEDGSIVLTENENGSLKTVDGESIVIGAWSTNQFDATWESYEGAYILIKNVKYRLPDDPAEAPSDVACQPNELVLFAGLGYSGYSYIDNLAVLGAYAPTTFRNSTMDIATSFEWSVKETGDGDEETTITSNNRHFSLYTKGGSVYEEFTLTGYNQDAASEPFTWGVGHCPNSDETGPRYEAIHAYAGHGASSFRFTDGTYATMTRQNPDGDLTFYTNWGTPDKYDRTIISKIYSYQGKPATPLYLTGVTLPFVGFSANDDFNLHIKLLKCTRNPSTGRLTLGDVIAEGDATLESVNDDYDNGITAVEFTELYKEDEFGMSETVDYLFIEDEFVIVIEGWDNGTFSGVLGSQNIDVSTYSSTWFEKAGEEGSMYSYTTWFPQLFIGLLDATYGYLHTEDETNLIFAKDGGQSSIHIDPMNYTTDEETAEPAYMLYIESIYEDGEKVEDIPEWLSFDVANEDYTTATATTEDGEEYEYFVNGIDYDLVINVEPLPEGVENRMCKVVFYQTGAKLIVTITQNINGHKPQFTITFDTDGGSEIPSITAEADSPITRPEDPTKEGYAFMGWEPEIPDVMPEGGLTVVAQWQINNYTLTYLVDGEVYMTYEVEYGSTITPEEEPTKEGYTFSGWSYIPSTMPAQNVVVMGTFSINNYTLTYMVDGGEYKTETLVYGTEIVPEEEPSKEGYTFSGWSEIPETMPANDVVVTGSFTVNSYALTYMVDGETYKTLTIAYGSDLTPEEAPTKAGYTFSGWEGLPETMPAHDVTVTGAFYIYGDVNIDNEVDLLDVVDIARFTVGTPAETFKVNLADLNLDNMVNITDAVVLVNEIAGNQNFVKEMRPGAGYDYETCDLELLGSEASRLSLCLNGETDFTAFQCTMDVPEGLSITGLYLNGSRSDGHQLLYNRMEDGSYRIVVLSLTNNVFGGTEGELLSVKLDGEASDEVSVRDIHFVTTKGTAFAFDNIGLSNNTETGIGSVDSEMVNGKSSNGKSIYDLQGRQRQALQRSVNIVNGKKVIVK